MCVLKIYLGVFAIVSILVGEQVSRITTAPPDFVKKVTVRGFAVNETNSNFTMRTQFIPETTIFELYGQNRTIEEFRIAIATSLSLLVGLIQMVAGFLRFGFITDFLSEPMLNGFTTGAACHVFSTQLSHILSIRPSG